MPFIDLTTEVSNLAARQRSDHGFPEIAGGDYRPDATAWAILCLDAYQAQPDIASTARARLRSSQRPDGSIPLTADHPDAFWPTLSGVLALAGHPDSRTAHELAIGFLLSTTGQRFQNDPDSPFGHDTMLPGWPWIDQTHAWVEPTAMAIRALCGAGLADHERTRAGIRLLLNRQLTDGGWNYGNTTVFGQQLNPMTVPTAKALWALAGQVERTRVETSLDFLKSQLHLLRTPLSLGWAIEGLASWGLPIEHGQELASACIDRQRRYGSYHTSQLAILLIALSRLNGSEATDA
jgi:hypothetical protein